MKRQRPAKNKKVNMPPVSKNPKVFEDAFEKSIGQHPADYLIEKLRGGSSVSSIEYLFDILSADIAMKNRCTSKGFDYYYIILVVPVIIASLIIQSKLKSTVFSPVETTT